MARKASGSLVVKSDGKRIPTNPKEREEWVDQETKKLLVHQESVGAGYAVIPQEKMPDQKAFTANMNAFTEALKDWVRSFYKIPQPPLPGIVRERSFA